MPGEPINLDRRFLSRLFPGLRLVGAIRSAFDLRKLVIAALGLALLQLGWAALDGLFPASAPITPATRVSVAQIRIDPGDPSWASIGLRRAHERLSEPFWNLVSPLLALFDPQSGWAAMLHALLAMIWLFLIWAICGCAICRITVVRVARMQQTSLGQALGIALRNFIQLILTPIIPLGCLAFFATILAGFGVLYRVPWIGSAFVGVLFLIPLCLALIMTLLAIALAAAWPLGHAAIAAGGEDALDALSRSFGYLNQRIGAMVALVGVAWVQGMIGVVLMDLLAAGVLRLTEWGLGLTGPATEMAAIFGRAGSPNSPVSAAAHSFWLNVVNLVAHAWPYSYFWTAAALIYLWLRYDVDGTPWEEIDPPGDPTASQIRPSVVPAADVPEPPLASPATSE